MVDKKEEPAFKLELTEERKKQLREEAAKAVHAAKIKDMEKAFLELAKAEERQKGDPNEEIIPYTIDVPGYATNVMIDGVQYVHGNTYDLPRRVYDSVRSVVATAWRHESVVGGANANQYRAPANLTVGAHGVVNRHLVRV